MISGAVLAILLAQTPLPSPMASSATRQTATTLTLAEALTHLIPDAANRFADDRGTTVVSPKGAAAYAMKFGIVGLTDCTIVDTEFPFAVCTGYRGTDATMARSVFDALKAKLVEFAAKGKVAEETVPNTQGPASLTTATYRPSANVQVRIEMVGIKGRFAVVFSVLSIPSDT